MSRRAPNLAALVACLAAIVSCGGEPGPVALDSGHACANCRMVVSDVHFAAQIVAPGEEPRFFDDIGCLVAAMSSAMPADAVAFVADHRTGAWTRAATAVYTRVDGLATPMGSHLIAHADTASRDQDPAASGGTRLVAADVFKNMVAPHAR